MDSIQRTLCTIPKIFVFKVPPLKGGRGFRAKEWDQTPIWTGRLRIVAQGTKCAILLEHIDNTGLFATCPIKSAKTVEQVVDSSRYYVLRIESSKGKAAIIGIGFEQRSQAFDFKAAIQDFQTQEKAEEQMAAIDSSIQIDYSLPADGKIQVNLVGKMKAKRDKENKDDEDDDDDGGDPFSFAPPPSSEGSKKSKKKKKKKKHKSKHKDKGNDSDDEKKGISSPGGSGVEVDDILGFGNFSMDSSPKPKASKSSPKASKSSSKSGGGDWEAF